MNLGELAKEFAQKYPLLYDGVVILLAVGVSAIADLVVKKIILRGFKQILSRLAEADNTGRELVLKIASRLANVVPAVILYYVPSLFPNVNGSIKLFVQRLSVILMTVFLTKSLMLILDLVNHFYQKRETAQEV